MEYWLIVLIPVILVVALLIKSVIGFIYDGRYFSDSLLQVALGMIFLLGWFYVTRDEQVFMNNLSIIADVFKNRLETITGPEVILLVILGVILFKKTA